MIELEAGAGRSKCNGSEGSPRRALERAALWRERKVEFAQLAIEIGRAAAPWHGEGDPSVVDRHPNPNRAPPSLHLPPTRSGYQKAHAVKVAAKIVSRCLLSLYSGIVIGAGVRSGQTRYRHDDRASPGTEPMTHQRTVFALSTGSGRAAIAIMRLTRSQTVGDFLTCCVAGGGRRQGRLRCATWVPASFWIAAWCCGSRPRTATPARTAPSCICMPGRPWWKRWPTA